jgi:hypothetical protein
VRWGGASWLRTFFFLHSSFSTRPETLFGRYVSYGLDTSKQISDSLRTAMKNKPEPYFGSGTWGLAKLIQDGSKWTINIPKDLQPGNYMIRNELAAVHSPGAPQICAFFLFVS